MLHSFLGETNDLSRLSFNYEELIPSLWPPPAHGFLKGCMSWHRETVGDSNYINPTAAQIILLVVTHQCYFVLGINNPTSRLLGMQWLESMVCYICSAVSFRSSCKMNHVLSVFGAMLQHDLECRWLGHLIGTSQ